MKKYKQKVMCEPDNKKLKRENKDKQSRKTLSFPPPYR
jgi:hypothetical protein